MLWQCTPGDIVVVIDPRSGDEAFVELGALNGTLPGSGKKGTLAWRPDYALVTTYDPERCSTINGTWRTMPIHIEVIDVHETSAHRREMRAMRRRGADHGEVSDPMTTRRTGVF